MDNLVYLEGQNDKLFRGINRYHLELVRYAESECQAWFNENEMGQPTPQDYSSDEPQVLSLSNICMMDGSWTSTSQFSGCGWAWMDNLGKVQLMGTQNYTRRESPLQSDVEALRWEIESMMQYSKCQALEQTTRT